MNTELKAHIQAQLNEYLRDHRICILASEGTKDRALRALYLDMAAAVRHDYQVLAHIAAAHKGE